jgi:Ohr subfamily peroxiredoxin
LPLGRLGARRGRGFQQQERDAVHILYTAVATAEGGRLGRVRTSDGRLQARLSVPAELGGPGGDGTNPEQLFAAGFAACFENALIVAARRAQVQVDGLTVSAHVGMGRGNAGGYSLEVELRIGLPGADRARLEALVQQADQLCPFSGAVRGNIPVRHVLEEG